MFSETLFSENETLVDGTLAVVTSVVYDYLCVGLLHLFSKHIEVHMIESAQQFCIQLIGACAPEGIYYLSALRFSYFVSTAQLVRHAAAQESIKYAPRFSIDFRMTMTNLGPQLFINRIP